MINIKFKVYHTDWDICAYPEIEEYIRDISSSNISVTIYKKIKDIFDNSELSKLDVKELVFYISAGFQLDKDCDDIDDFGYVVDKNNEGATSNDVLFYLSRKISSSIYEKIEEVARTYKELLSSGLLNEEKYSNGIYRETRTYYIKDGENIYV